MLCILAFRLIINDICFVMIKLLARVIMLYLLSHSITTWLYTKGKSICTSYAKGNRLK